MSGLTREKLRALGLVAERAGIDSPEDLEKYISIGVRSEYRLALIEEAVSGIRAELNSIEIMARL